MKVSDLWVLRHAYCCSGQEASKNDAEIQDSDFDTHKLAPLDVAQSQAWNRRIEDLLPISLPPISTKIHVRTEFSGAGTAEEALMSSAVLYNSDHNRVPISIDFKSIGDWAPAARQLSSVNHPSACQFGDIMGLVPEKLKEKLTEPISEKAIPICQMCLHVIAIHTKYVLFIFGVFGLMV